MAGSGPLRPSYPQSFPQIVWMGAKASPAASSSPETLQAEGRDGVGAAPDGPNPGTAKGSAISTSPYHETRGKTLVLHNFEEGVPPVESASRRRHYHASD